MTHDDALESEYCPPLDASVFRAIISDHDLSAPAGVRDARCILDALRADTLAYQDQVDASGFDPSGTGGASPLAEPSSRRASTANENTPPETDLDRLRTMFPRLGEYTIQHKLKSCGGFEKAVDELLNLSFLDADDGDAEGQLPKGVSAFSADEHHPAAAQHHRRGARKAKKKNRSPALDTGAPSEPPASNAWASAQQHISYLATRTHVSPAVVTSLYHQHARSVPRTLAAILELPATADALERADQMRIPLNAATLQSAHAHLTQHQALALAALTDPLIADAHSLAQALVPTSSTTTDLLPSYSSPLAPEDDDDDDTDNSPPYPPANPALATHLRDQAHTSFAHASSYHRRGKSNPLFGAAAGYYAQQARDAAARARTLDAAHADALVAANSTAEVVDLHYISVRDAERIALERVQAWWALRRGVRGLDGRVSGGVGASHLKIVTGRGAHSVGGRGRIGPAVSARLLREGWDISVEEGVVFVNGRGRRRG